MSESRTMFAGDLVVDARAASPEGDRALLFAARGGDRRACRDLVERYGPRLEQVITRTHGSRPFAEDVVQEAFIRALKCADQLREASSFYPWLVRIAIRVGHDLARKTRRERLIREMPDQISEENPEQETLASEDARRLDAALAQLSAHQRELLVLRYYSNLSAAELGEVFSKNEVAIRKELQRARARLRTLLGPWFEEGR